MFLCEVGMNNTLVGLLHPQADEKMFNFSKCSTPSLFLPLSFSPLWLFASVVVCLWVFTREPESRGVLLICLLSCLPLARSAHEASQTKRQRFLHLQTLWIKSVKWARHCSISWYNGGSCVTLQAVRNVSFFAHIALVNISVDIIIVSNQGRTCKCAVRPPDGDKCPLQQPGKVAKGATHVSCCDWNSPARCSSSGPQC